MKDNSSLSVEIYAFADAKGTDKYNKELSQRRSQSVLGYLEKNGVPSSRMIAKGFGEKMPAAPNEVQGKDNPSGRQMNRRTVLRIISEDPKTVA